jgi:hypothetical protein
VQLAPAAPSAQPELDYLNRHADGSAYLSSNLARVGGGGLFGQSSDTVHYSDNGSVDERASVGSCFVLSPRGNTTSFTNIYLNQIALEILEYKLWLRRAVSMPNTRTSLTVLGQTAPLQRKHC